MILDSGVCSIFHPEDIALSGEMPRKQFGLIFQSWYGLLSFETSPAWPTQGRQEQKADLRIRVLQCLAIKQGDVVVLRELADFPRPADGETVYRITRAYHGQDDNSPTLISDLTLEVYKP